MKYGIKLKSHNSYSWLYFFDEYADAKNNPLQFETIAQAEEYAQNHELHNFLIEVIDDSKLSGQKQLLT
jgi:hypothetical protein